MSQSLTGLESALPGLRAWSGSRQGVIDWGLIEEFSGIKFPDDYRALSEKYPPFSVGEYILISTPMPGKESAFVDEHRDSCEMLKEYISERQIIDRYLAGSPIPGEPGLYLLQFGGTPDGDFLCWWVNSTDPNSWPIVVQGHGGGWWEYQMGVVEFLRQLYSGILDVPIFPEGMSQ